MKSISGFWRAAGPTITAAAERAVVFAHHHAGQWQSLVTADDIDAELASPLDQRRTVLFVIEPPTSLRIDAGLGVGFPGGYFPLVDEFIHAVDVTIEIWNDAPVQQQAIITLERIDEFARCSRLVVGQRHVFIG